MTKRQSPGIFITRRKRPAAGTPVEALFARRHERTEAYEIDPQTVKQRGEDVEWSPLINPINRSRLRVENARRWQRATGEVSPRQGWPHPGAANPLLINGKPAY